MKGILAVILLIFLIPNLVVAVEGNSKSDDISCRNCTVGSCSCSIKNCQTGILSIYDKSDCTFTPTYSFTFSNGQKMWQPENSGNYYMKVLCDDGTKSECIKLTVKGGTSDSNQGNDHNGDEDLEEDLNENETEEKVNITEIKERIRERKEELEERLESMPEKEQKIWRNQNLVRETVHNLLELRHALDLKGGIGRNVSEIAREFNNSVKVIEIMEEKIEKRPWLKKVLLGGDKEAAEEIEKELEKNRERIEKLERLKEIVGDEELKQLLEEQIQQIEQEQNRLQELAQNEKKIKGLFGWLFR